MSSKCVFTPTSNLRGGIPVVFPQFGPNALPHTKALGQHGFARNSNDWKVIEVVAKDDEGWITLELKDNEATRKVWDHSFSLQIKNILRYDPIHKTQFSQEMKVKNLNTVGGFYFATALHTYFSIKDVTEVTLAPFKGVSLIDKIAGAVVKVEESDAVAITGETDRVYTNTGDEFRIFEGKSPSIAVSKSGFRDVVIWNVWSDKAKNMADLGEGEWKKYVCAEVAQASSPMWLLPNQTWIASQTFGSHIADAKL
jgi:glucose-6-phosphate 1-epimerase